MLGPIEGWKKKREALDEAAAAAADFRMMESPWGTPKTIEDIVVVDNNGSVNPGATIASLETRTMIVESERLAGMSDVSITRTVRERRRLDALTDHQRRTETLGHLGITGLEADVLASGLDPRRGEGLEVMQFDQNAVLRDIAHTIDDMNGGDISWRQGKYPDIGLSD